MRPNVATGPNEISSVMLRQTAHTISPYLTTTFNQSLSQGKFPTSWKTSNITPIFKTGDPASATNYRPISLLSLISKSLERQVHNAILDHLIANHLLSDNQFGFRPRASTQEAVLSVTTAWHLALERGNCVACVFFDISKAFDSLPHHLILQSLARVGICGSLLCWIQDYLSNRSQRVVLYGSASTKARATSGVPQGLILGPLLFIIFMDPLSTLPLSTSAGLTKFADDICYYREVSVAADCAAAQADVCAISDWMEERDLKINVIKIKAMTVSRKRRPPVLEIKVGESPIECVSSYRYLGIIITSNLSWSLHITKPAARPSEWCVSCTANSISQPHQTVQDHHPPNFGLWG